MDIKVDKMADLTWQSENEVKQDQGVQTGPRDDSDKFTVNVPNL